MERLQKLKLINLRQLSEAAGVSYSKIYFRKNGSIKKNFDLKDRTRIVNVIHKEIEPLFEELGYTITIGQMADQTSG